MDVHMCWNVFDFIMRNASFMVFIWYFFPMYDFWRASILFFQLFIIIIIISPLLLFVLTDNVFATY